MARGPKRSPEEMVAHYEEQARLAKARLGQAVGRHVWKAIQALKDAIAAIPDTDDDQDGITIEAAQRELRTLAVERDWDPPKSKAQPKAEASGDGGS